MPYCFTELRIHETHLFHAGYTSQTGSWTVEKCTSYILGKLVANCSIKLMYEEAVFVDCMYLTDQCLVA